MSMFINETAFWDMWAEGDFAWIEWAYLGSWKYGFDQDVCGMLLIGC